MAKMPGAKFVGVAGSVLMDHYDIVCIHTIVGHAPKGSEASDAHKAHFSTHADGTIIQSRDTKFQSRANGNGNHRIIAIENEDHGPRFPFWDSEKDPNGAPDFTDEQVEAIAKICAWAHKEHGIPLVRCPDSKKTSRGIAYHRQGVPGNFHASRFAFGGVVDGGEKWTDGFGKPCPGDLRITTVLERIIPRAQQIAAGIGSAGVKQTAIAEAADMLVGQDRQTGKLWLISGNTKLELTKGGATASGDQHSAGNTEHASVNRVLKMIAEAYPGSNPKFVALDPQLVSKFPEVR